MWTEALLQQKLRSKSTFTERKEKLQVQMAKFISFQVFDSYSSQRKLEILAG